MTNVTLFWFRRDLRLQDNAGLYQALRAHKNVLPVFIFDTQILDLLPDKRDPRVEFIYEEVLHLKAQLQSLNSDILVRQGKPLQVFKSLAQEYRVQALYANHDYEPEARKRDEEIARWAAENEIDFRTFKDQTLFEKDEILTTTGKPYTVFTPYKKKVLASLSPFYLKSYPNEKYQTSFLKVHKPEKILTLKGLGFEKTGFTFPDRKLSKKIIQAYAENRDFPGVENGTTHLGLHLRFGTVSVRELARCAQKHSAVWLSELIWRDFFMQILWHYPQVESESFRPEYDQIQWRNSKKDFQRWCEGQTGYPLVDAGMRELNATGFMHNRVRMVTASFLCKHLLIYWREGERYFAQKLLDFDLAANNGNWQWAAGSGCDAAPYFRIFNPYTQAKRFDPDQEYIRKWVPEVDSAAYVKPLVDHVEARSRCLHQYMQGLKKGQK